jgi:Acetyl-CoA carboxylase, carboxyltransferase component (subunits alpha and beta)
MSPADGMVTGIGAVNGTQFDDEQARCAVMAYDYTVFAGTQGVTNHKKKDRLLTLADKWALPVVVFAEGGGGRPGDEWPTPAGRRHHDIPPLRRPERQGADHRRRSPVAALPVTPRCSAVATSSSPTRLPTSGSGRPGDDRRAAASAYSGPRTSARCRCRPPTA